MKRLTIGAVVTLSLVLVASAGAAVFTIHGDWKMGSFKVKRDGTLRGAIDAFGPTGSRDRNGEVCTVRWPRHGLKIVFYNLGRVEPMQASQWILLQHPSKRAALEDGSAPRDRRSQASPQELVSRRRVPWSDA